METTLEEGGIQFYGHVCVAYQGLYSCTNNCTVPKHTSSNCDRAKEVYSARTWYEALTLVEQTKLYWSNMLGYGTDGVSVPLEAQTDSNLPRL